MIFARLAGSPVLRLFSSAVLGQALLSAANFIVGLLLIRHAKDDDYGHFILVQTAMMLMVSLQGAWISGPLTVIASKRSEHERRLMVSAAYRGQRLVARATVPLGFLLLFLAWQMGLLHRDVALICAAGVIATWAAMDREYLRTVLLIYTRSHVLLGADMVYTATLLAGIAAAIQLPQPTAAWAVLALALAALFGSLPSRRSLARDPGWAPEGGDAVWRQMRPLAVWASAGVVIYWSFSQGYNYLLAARLDVKAVAAVAATRMLLMPVNLLSTGVKGLLIPLASRWLPTLKVRGLIRRLALMGFGLLIFAAVYCLLLWLFRDWVFANLLRKEIPGRDVLLGAWTLIFLLCLFRDCLQSVLYVRERFRVLTYIAAVNAVVSYAAMLLLMEVYGAPGAVFGILIGEVIYTLAVFELLRREARRPEPAPAALNPPIAS